MYKDSGLQVSYLRRRGVMRARVSCDPSSEYRLRLVAGSQAVGVRARLIVSGLMRVCTARASASMSVSPLSRYLTIM